MEEFSLPVGVTDCYEVLLVDDWGDGLTVGGGSIKLYDSEGGIVFEKDLSAAPFAALPTIVEVTGSPDGTEELEGLNSLNLFPNPTSSKLNVQFELAETMSLQVAVYNILGQPVKVLAEYDFVAG